MKTFTGDIIILHTFYIILLPYEVWFLRYKVRQTEFSVILSHFPPSTALPFNNPENKNFEKLKKASGDVIILHMRTKNHNHMMHIPDIWGGTDITFCYFGPFLPFTPLLILKN